MIIPIGHEQTTVQRLPWISIIIIVLCFLAYVYSFHIVEPNDAVADSRFREALQYYHAHPYLTLEPRFDEFMRGILPPDVLKELDKEPPAGVVLPKLSDDSPSQRELDRLTTRFFDALEDNPIWQWGLIPSRFSYVTLITSMFMHGGFLHLLGNMFFLWLSGPFIEDRWGRPLFIGFYLLGGIVAAGLFATHYPNLQVPMVGASGAVAACMGAFLILFWHVKIKFFYWIWIVIRGTFSAPAWLMLIIWFARELLSAQLADSGSSGGGGGVAYWAHIWGFLFGVLVAAVIRYGGIERKFLLPAIEKKTTIVLNPVIEQALEIKERGQGERALKMLYAEARKNPSNADVAVTCWELACELGQTERVAPVLFSLIRMELKQGTLDNALSHWWEIRRRAPDLQVNIQAGIKLSQVLIQANRLGEAQAVLRSAMDGINAETPSGACVMMVRLALKTKTPLQPGVVQTILNHPEVPQATKKSLAQMPGVKATIQPSRVAAPPRPTQPPEAASQPGVGAKPARIGGIRPQATKKGPPPPLVPPQQNK
ncbi:rhomboid family intramembrane serine protease [Acidobacteriota bacterium]